MTLSLGSDILYHAYWCGNAQCETMWHDLIKDAGHDPSLEGIKDEELRKLILEAQEKPMPGVLPRAPSGMLLDLDDSDENPPLE